MDATIETEMLSLLSRRGTGKTICPSEVARRVSPDDWRSLMPRVREVAAKLQRTGRVVVTQRGTLVDPLSAKGPIRIGNRSDDLASS